MRIFLVALIVFISISIFFIVINDRERSYYQGPKSDHFNGRRFFNPDKPFKNSYFSLLKWRFTSNKIKWPEQIKVKKNDVPPLRVTDKLRVSYIGHASFLIQVDGLNILTDPWFSKRASFVNWTGPKRVSELGIKLADLPKIDIILVSHNHYDHLDRKTLLTLWQRDQPRIITPLGNDKIIKSFDNKIQAEAYDWNDKIKINDKLNICLDKMHHWSARGIFDRNKALWAAFILQTSQGNIYFVGDSGYGNGDYFREAEAKYGPMWLSILPIGAYEPRWFMKYAHMNPEEAVLAHQDLKSKYSIASHFETVQLTDEAIDKPRQDLEAAILKHQLKKNAFKALQIGEFIELKN